MSSPRRPSTRNSFESRHMNKLGSPAFSIPSRTSISPHSHCRYAKGEYGWTNCSGLRLNTPQLLANSSTLQSLMNTLSRRCVTTLTAARMRGDGPFPFGPRQLVRQKLFADWQMPRSVAAGYCQHFPFRLLIIVIVILRILLVLLFLFF
jgi:hypothetical protein